MDVPTSALDLGDYQVEREGVAEGYKGSRVCVGFSKPEHTEDPGKVGRHEKQDDV